MCEGNRANAGFPFYLLPVLLFVFAAAALRAEEPGPSCPADRMYLISEAELRSIENYKANSEREKADWLLQAQRLKVQADRLRRESETLNSQLEQARERNRRLERSFNEYEAGQLTLISLKNGEIAGLKQEAADRTLEAERYRGKSVLYLAIIVALLIAVAGYTAFRLRRFFR